MSGGDSSAGSTSPGRTSFPDHFSGAAEGYAAHRPGYPPELADFLAGVAPARELAWDAGCGSGQLSVLLAARFARVVATDASAQQLAGRTRHPRVRYRRALSEAGGLPDGAIDLAAAAQAAHWFDLPRYYREVRRVARPGAVVCLVTYGMVRVEPGVDRVIGRFYEDVLAPFWPPERRWVEEGYRSLPFPFDPVPAPTLEIRARWTLRRLVGYVETWSAVRGLVEARGEGPLEAFREELSGAWGRPDPRSVRWPLSLRTGRV